MAFPTARRSKFRGIAGMTKLRRILAKAPPEVSEVLKVEVKEFAHRVEQTARGFAIMGDMASRRYASSISTKVSRSGFSADIGLVTAAGRKAAWFGHFIEWGTKAGTREWKGKPNRAMRRRTGSFFHPGTPARPALLPSFELQVPGMRPRIDKAINDILERLASGPSGD